MTAHETLEDALAEARILGNTEDVIRLKQKIAQRDRAKTILLSYARAWIKDTFYGNLTLRSRLCYSASRGVVANMLFNFGPMTHLS